MLMSLYSGTRWVLHLMYFHNSLVILYQAQHCLTVVHTSVELVIQEEVSRMMSAYRSECTLQRLSLQQQSQQPPPLSQLQE